jgi:hypothetical protein
MAIFHTSPQHYANTGQIYDKPSTCTTQLKGHRTQNMYPLVYRLFNIATTLPLDTAEVDELFTGEVDQDQSQTQHQHKNTESPLEH